MKLYNLEPCPYCRMVRDKLASLGLSYEKEDVSTNPKERSEVYKASGQYFVPVLIDGDLVFDDEEKIINYLDKTYGPGKE